jgi:transcriptional regulator with GAF, ATPase, and Fis domain
MATTSQDEFLKYVFPGESPGAIQFRDEIDHLNTYCHRFKGAISCVLLTGESGVGKNYTAQAISAHSQWLTLTDEERVAFIRQGQFVLAPNALIDRLLMKQHRSGTRGHAKTVRRLATVLGPQLVDDLAASELFGHKRGAFTGAMDDRDGVFGDDAVDDVLLDEVGDLSPKIQAKLLQFVDTRTFRPTGGLSEDEKQSEHRLFLATNRNLEERVSNDQFRGDLFWRIQGHRIHIPPLRDRRDVIRDIAYSVLRSVNQRQRGDEQIGPSLEDDPNPYRLLSGEEGKGKGATASSWVIHLTEEDLQWCESYDWPGNVRELRQRLERYVYNDGQIRLRDVMPAPTLTGVLGKNVSDESLVQRAVHQYLDSVLQGKQEPPGQPGLLLDIFQQQVKAAIYHYKTGRRLTGTELRTIFPEAKDAETTIGRWRTAV